MSEDENTTLAEVSAAPELFTWEIWMADCDDDGMPTLTFRGTFEHTSAYGFYSYSGDPVLTNVAKVGGGAGAYVLIHDDRIVRLNIRAETRYTLADEAS